MLVGTIGLLVFLFLVVMGLPIAFSLFLVGIGGLFYVVGFDGAMAASQGILLTHIAKYTWSVIPMFIFMGQLGYFSGLLADIFEVARRWLGRLPGGLAISVEAAAAIFGACSADFSQQSA